MSDIVIRCERLGKRYRIGQREPYRTFRDTLVDVMIAPFRGMSRLMKAQSAIRDPESNNTIWALKDVSFEVKRGEVVDSTSS